MVSGFPLAAFRDLLTKVVSEADSYVRAQQPTLQAITERFHPRAEPPPPEPRPACVDSPVQTRREEPVAVQSEELVSQRAVQYIPPNAAPAIEIERPHGVPNSSGSVDRSYDPTPIDELWGLYRDDVLSESTTRTELLEIRERIRRERLARDESEREVPVIDLLPDEDEDDVQEVVEDDEVFLTPTGKKPRVRKRRSAPRSKTVAVKSITRAVLALGWIDNPDPSDLRAQRPKTRADCKDGQRPCPWVSCEHHMYLDIQPETGAIKFNFPDKEPWELEHSCVSDLADAGAQTLEQVAEKMNLTRERVRQIEVKAYNLARSKFTPEEVEEMSRTTNDNGTVDWHSRMMLAMIG